MLRTIIATALALAGLAASAESFWNTREYYELMEQTGTAEDLVESLWAAEIERGVPQCAMTRAAFGIDTKKTYTTEEKANLIYRARELRRGRNLCVRAMHQEHMKVIGDRNIPAAQRAKAARDFKTERVSPKKFLDTDKGKQMVEYLEKVSVGVDGLIDYLVKEETEKHVITDQNVTRRKTKPLSEMNRDEQIIWLWRGQETLNREEKMRVAEVREKAKKKKESQNENGKPPVRPWRAK